MVAPPVERRRLRRGDDLVRTWGEVAAVLAVCERTARRWAQHDGLPVFKRPGRTATVTASRRALLAWLSRQSRSVRAAGTRNRLACP